MLKMFTVGFLKLLSTHPIHIVVWGNFPFNVIIESIVDVGYKGNNFILDTLPPTHAATHPSGSAR